MKFLTAGESHGKALVGILEGVPAGLYLSVAKISEELNRRRRYHGRSKRMQIECDEVEFLSGLRADASTGAPISFVIKNNDFRPQIFEADNGIDAITRPRPGHADYSGMVKYGFADARMIAERASGRETASRTVIGAIAKQLLSLLSINVCSHTVSIGGIKSANTYYSDQGILSAIQNTDNSCSDEKKFIDNIGLLADADRVRCLDSTASQKITKLIDETEAAGDTLGGEIEIIMRGLPAGFGNFSHYEKRLDYRISALLMSIPSVKGIFIGNKHIHCGLGSEVADPIVFEGGGIKRRENNGGGVEGGISNGSDVVLTLAVKPVPTMKNGAKTVDFSTGENVVAHYERSDICVVPAVAVVAENMLAYAIAEVILEELGGNTMAELIKRFLQKIEKNKEFCELFTAE